MEKGQSTFCPEEILLVEIFVLKQFRCLFGGVYACVEWFLFVDANRDRKNVEPVHNYDIVIGPIANDGVVLQLTNYREGLLRENFHT